MERKLRILHLTSAYRPFAVGGAEVVVSMLAEAQAAQGHEVHVMHLSPIEAESRRENGVEIHPYKPVYLAGIGEHAKSSGWKRALNKAQISINPFFLRHFSNALEKIRPDVVHTHSLPDLSSFCWAVAKRHGARVVHTLHDYDLMCRRATMYNDGRCDDIHGSCKLHNKAKTFALKHVDKIVSISQCVKQLHIDHGIFEALDPRVSVIWNAIPPEKYKSQTELRSNSALRIGYIGRLVPEKGIFLLLEAVSKLGASGWSLSIAGKAPNSDEAFRNAVPDGFPVDFVGWVNPSEFFSSIDVLVVPSLWDEPFGLTTIEGLSHGLIVVGSNRGAIPEILGEISSELVFDVSTPNGLANKLDDIINQPEVYRAMVGDISSLIEKLSIQKMLNSYSEIYENRHA